jgi:hypothetical protein
MKNALTVLGASSVVVVAVACGSTSDTAPYDAGFDVVQSGSSSGGDAASRADSAVDAGGSSSGGGSSSSSSSSSSGAVDASVYCSSKAYCTGTQICCVNDMTSVPACQEAPCPVTNAGVALQRCATSDECAIPGQTCGPYDLLGLQRFNVCLPAGDGGGAGGSVDAAPRDASGGG